MKDRKSTRLNTLSLHDALPIWVNIMWRFWKHKKRVQNVKNKKRETTEIGDGQKKEEEKKKKEEETAVEDEGVTP